MEYFLKRVIKGFTRKVSFVRRPERSKGARHVNGYMWETYRQNEASESVLEVYKIQQGGQPG